VRNEGRGTAAGGDGGSTAVDLGGTTDARPPKRLSRGRFTPGVLL
jgi:hypothetical protein